MKKISIILILFFNSFVGFSHNAQLSTMVLMQGKDKKWNLVISASLSAFQVELKNADPSLNLEKINADEFQALIVKHLRENIKIKANDGSEAQFVNGRVVLGHETDINFEVTNMPNNLQSLDLEHLGFGTIKDHFCVLKIASFANKSGEFLLQNENNHAVSLAVKNNIFIPIKAEKLNKVYLGGAIILLISSLIIGIVFIQKQQKLLRILSIN